MTRGTPTKTCTEFLAMARSVESMVKTETLSRELLGQVGKVPIGSIDTGVGAGVGVEAPGVGHTQGHPGLLLQVPSNVEDVEKSIHQENVLHTIRYAKDVK